MEFSKILRSDAKILLADGVTLFRSDDGSLFLKYNNKLSKIPSSSELSSTIRDISDIETSKKS